MVRGVDASRIWILSAAGLHFRGGGGEGGEEKSRNRGVQRRIAESREPNGLWLLCLSFGWLLRAKAHCFGVDFGSLLKHKHFRKFQSFVLLVKAER